MKRGVLFCLITIGLFLGAGTVSAKGRYQRTRDGRTLVWNEFPNAGEAATWSGRRDKDGYATGPGTLTWYRFERDVLTGSNIAAGRYSVVAQRSGKMVHGRFEGSASETAETETQATPSATPAPKAIDKTAKEKPKMVVTPPAPREVPSPAATFAPSTPPVAAAPRPTPTATPTPASATVVTTPTGSASPSSVSDSLRLLTSPPSSLQSNEKTEASSTSSEASATPSSSPAATPESTPAPTANPVSTPPPAAGRPQLSAGEVVEMAESEARSQGYDVGEFERARPRYDVTNETWTVTYDQRLADGTAGKHFSVKIEDKTKKKTLEK